MDKFRRAIAGSLVVLVLLAGAVLAKKEADSDQKKCPLANADSSSGTTKQACPLAANMMYSQFFLDGPGALYGQAEMLGLSESQKSQLVDIQKQARVKALAVLNAEQKAKLGDLPDEPMSMASLHKKMGGKIDTASQKATCPMMKGASQSKAEQTSEQTTCPVMGGDINKSISADYKGKKVYFCCAGCKPKFEKNPEKYASKLP